MKKNFKLISGIFYVAAVYDGILGLIFLIFPLAAFNLFNITHPNHTGYIHFPAGLLIVFAIMFFNIAKHPPRNRILIPYGILLKVTYCSVVFYHWFSSGIPNMWKYFAVFDFAWGLIFIYAYEYLGKTKPD